MSLLHARLFLEKAAAAEAAKPLDTRLMQALDNYLDIALPEVPKMLGISPEQAHLTVEKLRKEGRVALFKDGDRYSVRRVTGAMSAQG